MMLKHLESWRMKAGEDVYKGVKADKLVVTSLRVGWNSKWEHCLVLATKALSLKPSGMCCCFLTLVSDHIWKVPCIRAGAEGSVVELNFKHLFANGAVTP